MNIDVNRSLTERFAPKRFEEIVGQIQAVETLQSLVRASLGRSILLIGPHGCGKSTFANIYGKGLYCESPLGERPCGSCEGCDQFEEEQAFSLYIFGRGDFDDVAYAKRVLEVSLTGLNNARVVAIIDQAHLVSDIAWDILHPAISRPAPEVTFIVCVENLEQLRARTRELLFRVEVRPPIYQDRLDFIGRLIKLAGIKCSPSAMRLIAELATGSFTKLGREIEQISRRGEINTENIEHFYYAETPAQTYVDAVLRGTSFSDQRKELVGWDAAPTDKARMIANYLVRVADPLVGLVSPYGSASLFTEHRQTISNLLNEAGQERPREFLETILEVWGSASPIYEADLLRRASRFDSLVNASRQGETASEMVQRWGAERKRTSSFRSVPRSKKPSDKIGTDLGFLAVDLVKRRWDQGAFLIEQYGTPINTAIRFDHSRIKTLDGVDASVFITQFGRELRLRVDGSRRRHGQGSPAVHWLYVTRNVASGRVTDLVAYIPPDLDVNAWLTGHFIPNHASVEEDAIIVRQYRASRHNPAELRDPMDLRRHWTLLKWLIASLDPKDPIAARLLRKTLRAERFNRPAGPRMPQSTRVSRGLDIGAMKLANADLSVRSAFEVDAPSNKFQGWEIMAYHYRRKVLAQKEKLAASICEEYSGTERKRRLELFRERWASDKTIRDAGFSFSFEKPL